MENPQAVRQSMAAGDGEGGPVAVPMSARTGEGIERLLAVIDALLPVDPVTSATFRFPISEGAPVHLLHEFGQVRATRYSADWCEMEAEAPESRVRRLAKYLVSA